MLSLSSGLSLLSAAALPWPIFVFERIPLKAKDHLKHPVLSHLHALITAKSLSAALQHGECLSHNQLKSRAHACHEANRISCCSGKESWNAALASAFPHLPILSADLDTGSCLSGGEVVYAWHVQLQCPQHQIKNSIQCADGVGHWCVDFSWLQRPCKRSRQLIQHGQAQPLGGLSSQLTFHLCQHRAE